MSNSGKSCDSTEVDVSYFEDHALTHKAPDSCDLCHDFWELEWKQEKNAKKLRIRHVPQNKPEVTPRDTAYHTINCRLNNVMTYNDIVDGSRVRGWDGSVDPKDLVVTFASKQARDYVYGLRRFIEDNGFPIKILDELIPERVKMFQDALKFFGPQRVDTAFGCVKVYTDDENKHYIFTQKQLKELISEEFNNMNGQSQKNLI